MSRCPILIHCVEEETGEMLLCFSFGHYYWLPKKHIDPRPVLHECDTLATIPMELAMEHGLIAAPEELFEERAAIMEFDGGLTREDAEKAAAEIVGPRSDASCSSRNPS